MQGYQQEPHGSQPYAYATSRPVLESGVGKFMSNVYAWMAVGFAVTAATAFFVATNEAALFAVHVSPLRWLFLFGPLAMSWFLLPRLPTMDRPIAVGSFFVFTAMLGAWFSYIPLIYTATSIFMVLGATIGMFGGMALLGWVTKRDLSGMGQFLLMALLGSIIASLLNVFVIGSFGMSTVISAIVAIASAGLTAYHTQAIKQFYLVNGRGRSGNFALLGALMLYVDFVNLFTALLRLFGSSRD